MHKQAITRTYRNKTLFQIILRQKNMMLKSIRLSHRLARLISAYFKQSCHLALCVDVKENQ